MSAKATYISLWPHSGWQGAPKMLIGNKLDLDEARAVTGADALACAMESSCLCWAGDKQQRSPPRRPPCYQTTLYPSQLPSPLPSSLWCDRMKMRRSRHSPTSWEFRSCVRPPPSSPFFHPIHPATQSVVMHVCTPTPFLFDSHCCRQ